MLAFRVTSPWRRAAIVVTAAVVLLMSGPTAARADPGVPVPPDNLLSNRGLGPVAAADRDFVIKVRLAGLWEIPAGEMAQQKSENSRIREIGRSIAAQHVILDKLDRKAAATLRIDLPRAPNLDQQSWLGEMRDAEGEQFDRIYIDRLRAAHGKIFPAIATVRATTRNDTVRKLAQQANQFVATHMTLLESSGIVDFGALPTAPAPPASSGPLPPTGRVLAATTGSSRLTFTTVLLLLAVGVATGVFAGRRLTTHRRRTYRPRRPRYDDDYV